jgi:hypothetical protein
LDKESILNSAPIFPAAARPDRRQSLAAHGQAKRHQHQTETRQARKSNRGFPGLKSQTGGSSFWFHGHDITLFGLRRLIDKNVVAIVWVYACRTYSTWPKDWSGEAAALP